MPLLRLEPAPPLACTLLLDQLPLLYRPAEPMAAETCEAAAEHWQRHLERLCNVLRYHRLLPASGAGSSLGASSDDGTADESASQGGGDERDPGHGKTALLLLTLAAARSVPAGARPARAPPLPPPHAHR